MPVLDSVRGFGGGRKAVATTMHFYIDEAGLIYKDNNASSQRLLIWRPQVLELSASAVFLKILRLQSFMRLVLVGVLRLRNGQMSLGRP